MRVRIAWLLPCLAAISLLGAVVVPESVAALVTRVALTALTATVVIAAVRRHRPGRPLAWHWRHPDPWALVTLSLFARVAADVALIAQRSMFSLEWLWSVQRSVFGLTATALMMAALVEMARHRFGERFRDQCSEAVIMAGWLTMVIWLGAFEPFLRISGYDVASGAPHGVALAAALVLAVLACSLLGSFENSQPALAGLSVALALPVLAVVVRFFGEATQTAEIAALSVAVSACGIALIGWSADHPTMSLYEEPANPSGARLGRLRLVNLLLPAVLGPLLLTGVLTGLVDLSPLTTAGFSILLSTLVIIHLLGMVQARASSTHWASHDMLTGLPNRALFRERCSQALERGGKLGQRAAVLYLDLDRFKHINDSMGHEAGDQLLALVAKRLIAGVEEGDTVARLGGDEFAILLPNINGVEEASDLARRLLASFSTPFALKPKPVLMSPSVGISISDESDNLETFLTQADTAMYRAKESGRNNFAVWSMEMNEKANERLTLEMSLHSALSNNEFRLVYQPKVELATGRITGVEALLRWHHPTLGVVSPVTFITIAEESGLITQIGEWVLETACAQASKWREQGFGEISVAVNLSSRQFQQQRVASLVSRTLRRTGLAPRLLELELTESVAMAGGEATVAQLRELRELGVTCAIDDFGTGYSNLSYLSRFPVDTLKIDKAFVQQIDKSQSDAAIVMAIIAMAHGLGLQVVAEGVETPEQAAFLRANACDLMQGFLFSRPLPPADVEALFLVGFGGATVGSAVSGNTRPPRFGDRRSPWQPTAQSSD